MNRYLVILLLLFPLWLIGQTGSVSFEVISLPLLGPKCSTIGSPFLFLNSDLLFR
jgi:hypothetical protein